jgi:flagellin
MASVDVTRIASNIGALNALNSLQTINKELAIHQGRLQTGKRINSAADDPAGLTIATKMLARSEGLKTALNNIGDANNMLSVAEGGMSKINDILVQMRSKAEQAASDTLGTEERNAIQTQLSAYSQQIQDLVDQTKWNGVKLLDQTTGTKQFQTGVDEGENTTWTLSAALDPSVTGLNVSTKVASNTVTLDPTQMGAGKALTNSVSLAGTLGTFSRLTTGTYGVKVVDASVAAKVTKTGTFNSGTDAVASVAGTGLASGSHTLEFVSGAGANNAYAITYKLDGVQATAANVDMTAGGNLFIGAGANGVNLAITAGTTSANFSSGTKITLDTLAANSAKLALVRGDGSAVGVSADGTSTVASNNFYMAQNTTQDTGVGANFTTGAIADLVLKIGGTSTFSYAQANNFSVDVSTATIAASYMTKVNSAMDKVNQQMSSLGSLMARLTFKEDAVSTAQVNVEASYSRIMNANMAEEQVNASKYAILQQTATAMLAQANQAPQSLLSLFR